VSNQGQSADHWTISITYLVEVTKR